MSSNPQTPELSDFFFELSNQDRLDIMKLIDKRPLKLSHISKELDLPMQEISRQKTLKAPIQIHSLVKIC